MHPAEIQAALKLKGFSQADIARECGVQAATVSMVINGRGRSAQVEERIARVTGYTRMDLWPQWYDGPAGKSNMVIVDRDEALLLRSYRALSPSQRAEALALVQALEAGHDRRTGNVAYAVEGGHVVQENITAGGQVVIGNGGRTAGRDIVQGAPAPKRKPPTPPKKKPRT